MGASLLWIKDDRYPSQIWSYFASANKHYSLQKKMLVPHSPCCLRSNWDQFHILCPRQLAQRNLRSRDLRDLVKFLRCAKLVSVNNLFDAVHLSTNNQQLVDFGYFVACSWRAETEPQLSPCADRETSWSMARKWLAAVYRSAAGTGQWRTVEPLESELWQLNSPGMEHLLPEPQEQQSGGYCHGSGLPINIENTTSLVKHKFTMVHLPPKRSEINGESLGNSWLQHRLEQIASVGWPCDCECR